MKKHELRVVVIGTKKQANDYLKREREIGDIIIPVGPWAIYYADKYGWESRNLSSLWIDSEYKKASSESIKRVDTLISELNDYSIGSNPNERIEIGNYYAFQLWVIIGQIHHNHFIIKSILKSINPERVLIYTSISNTLFMDFRPNPNRIFAEIFTESGYFCKNKMVIKEVQENIKNYSLKSKILSSLPSVISRMLKENRMKLSVERNNKNMENQLLVVGAPYEWLKISQYQSFNNNYSLHYLSTLSIPSKKKSSKVLKSIINKSITYNGSIVYDLSLLSNKMESDLDFFIQNQEKTQNKIKQFKAVVSSVFVFPWENYIAHMAAKLNKPVILWQHGEKGSFHDITIPYTEIKNTTHYFSYGTAVKKMEFKSYIGKDRLKAVETVGTLAKKEKCNGGGSNIIYVTGKWFKTASPFLGKSDNDYRLYNNQKTILEFLNSIATDNSSIFKANNSPGLNEVPHSYPGIRVEYNTSFIELLKKSKIIIIDSPGTTLIEVCFTKLPIFVVGDSFEYYSEFKNLIKKRVIWCETSVELVSKLNDFIQSGIYKADLNNEEYINNYSEKFEKEEIATKAVSLLKDIIN